MNYYGQKQITQNSNAKEISSTGSLSKNESVFKKDEVEPSFKPMDKDDHNYKGQLQEYLMRHRLPIPGYKLSRIDEQKFMCTLGVLGMTFSSQIQSNKRRAEQEAAKAAIYHLTGRDYNKELIDYNDYKMKEDANKKIIEQTTKDNKVAEVRQLIFPKAEPKVEHVQQRLDADDVLSDGAEAFFNTTVAVQLALSDWFEWSCLLLPKLDFKPTKMTYGSKLLVDMSSKQKALFMKEKDTYRIPGGKGEFNETPQATLIRESGEEGWYIDGILGVKPDIISIGYNSTREIGLCAIWICNMAAFFPMSSKPDLLKIKKTDDNNLLPYERRLIKHRNMYINHRDDQEMIKDGSMAGKILIIVENEDTNTTMCHYKLDFETSYVVMLDRTILYLLSGGQINPGPGDSPFPITITFDPIMLTDTFIANGDILAYAYAATDGVGGNIIDFTDTLMIKLNYYTQNFNTSFSMTVSIYLVRPDETQFLLETATLVNSDGTGVYNINMTHLLVTDLTTILLPTDTYFYIITEPSYATGSNYNLYQTFQITTLSRDYIQTQIPNPYPIETVTGDPLYVSNYDNNNPNFKLNKQKIIYNNKTLPTITIGADYTQNKISFSAPSAMPVIVDNGSYTNNITTQTQQLNDYANVVLVNMISNIGGTTQPETANIYIGFFGYTNANDPVSLGATSLPNKVTFNASIYQIVGGMASVLYLTSANILPSFTGIPLRVFAQWTSYITTQPTTFDFYLLKYLTNDNYNAIVFPVPLPVVTLIDNPLYISKYDNNNPNFNKQKISKDHATKFITQNENAIFNEKYIIKTSGRAGNRRQIIIDLMRGGIEMNPGPYPQNMKDIQDSPEVQTVTKHGSGSDKQISPTQMFSHIGAIASNWSMTTTRLDMGDVWIGQIQLPNNTLSANGFIPPLESFAYPRTVRPGIVGGVLVNSTNRLSLINIGVQNTIPRRSNETQLSKDMRSAYDNSKGVKPATLTRYGFRSGDIQMLANSINASTPIGDSPWIFFLKGWLLINGISWGNAINTLPIANMGSQWDLSSVVGTGPLLNPNSSPVFGENNGGATVLYPVQTSNGNQGTLTFAQDVTAIPYDNRDRLLYIRPEDLIASEGSNPGTNLAIIIALISQYPFLFNNFNIQTRDIGGNNPQQQIFTPFSDLVTIPGPSYIGVILPMLASVKIPTSQAEANANLVYTPTSGPDITTNFPVANAAMNLSYGVVNNTYRLSEYLYTWFGPNSEISSTQILNVMIRTANMLGNFSDMWAAFEFAQTLTVRYAPPIYDGSAQTISGVSALRAQMSAVDHTIPAITTVNFPIPQPSRFDYVLPNMSVNWYSAISSGILTPDIYGTITDNRIAGLGSYENLSFARYIARAYAAAYDVFFRMASLTKNTWDTLSTALQLTTIKSVYRNFWINDGPQENGLVIAKLWTTIYEICRRMVGFKPMLDRYGKAFMAYRSNPANGFISILKLAGGYYGENIPTVLNDFWLAQTLIVMPKGMNEAIVGDRKQSGLTSTRNRAIFYVGQYLIPVVPERNTTYIGQFEMPYVDDTELYNLKMLNRVFGFNSLGPVTIGGLGYLGDTAIYVTAGGPNLPVIVPDYTAQNMQLPVAEVLSYSNTIPIMDSTGQNILWEILAVNGQIMFQFIGGLNYILIPAPIVANNTPGPTFPMGGGDANISHLIFDVAVTDKEGNVNGIADDGPNKRQKTDGVTTTVATIIENSN